MSIRFDASGDRYTLSSPPTPPLSVAFWGRIAVDRNAYSSFFCLDSGAVQLFLGTNATGTNLDLYLTSPGGQDHLGTNLTAGTWYHIALVIASLSDWKVYLNGVQDISTTDTPDTPSGEVLYFANDSVSEFLNGNLAAAKLWTAALTVGEIQQEIYSHKPVRTANLYAFWPMLATGDGATDYSGNAHSLTSAGTLATEDGPPAAWNRGPSMVFIPAAAAPGGRTTKNTRSNPLGIEVGMGWQMAHEHSQASK